MKDVLPTDMAWFTGLFVGEGNTRIAGTQAVMTISMTTKDTLDQIMERIGVGKLYGPYGPTTRNRPIWRWQVSDMLELRELATAMRPWLDESKTRQVDRVLTFIDERRKPKVCPVCLSEFGHRSLKKKYCSQACNKKAWLDRNENRKLINAERRRARLQQAGGSYDRICPTCLRTFTPASNNTIFCSSNCKAAKYTLECAWCSTTFTSPIATTQCCSKSCAGFIRERERKQIATGDK